MFYVYHTRSNCVTQSDRTLVWEGNLLGSTAPTRNGAGSQENRGFRCEYIINMTFMPMFNLNDIQPTR